MSEIKHDKIDEMKKFVDAFVLSVDKIKDTKDQDELTKVELEAKRQLVTIQKAAARAAWDLKNNVTAQKMRFKNVEADNLKKELGL